jgi:hypothetical protein
MKVVRDIQYYIFFLSRRKIFIASPIYMRSAVYMLLCTRHIFVIKLVLLAVVVGRC